MFAKKLKSLLIYSLILALGLGAGYMVPRMAKWLTPAYTEGNFAAYFPDAKTNVVVYGTETCPFCAQARAYLRERNIPFADIDVAKSAKGKQDFSELKGDKVPLILVGGRRLVGFNKAALEAALAKAGHPAKG